MRVFIDDFGKDHWSTFAYLEVIVVDRRGIVQNEKMRTSFKRHPLFAHPRNPTDGAKYPTRFKGGEMPEHDDWDCMIDLRDAGLIRIIAPRSETLWDIPVGRRGPITVTNRRPTQPFVKVHVGLTDYGRKIISSLREHIGNGHPVHMFELD